MSLTDNDGFEVTLYDGSYTVQGVFRDYVTNFVTHEWNGVGTGTLAVREAHPVAAALMDCDTEVVPIRCTSHGRVWTGRVAHAILDGQIGNGVVTATLVDEFLWLRAILAWGDPTHALSAQTTATNDRTGPLETVVKGYVQDNATRLNIPMYVVPAPTVDTSPTVTLSGRFAPLDDLVLGVMKANNRSLTIAMWMPGDPKPPGGFLGSPTLVVDMVVAVDNAQITWTDTFGGVTGRTVNVTSPNARTGIGGGSGVGLARILASYTDPAQASLGPFAFPEYFLNDTSATTTTLMMQKLQTDMTLNQTGKGSIAVTVSDGKPWVFGRDYRVGDTVGAEFLGVSVRDRVTRVAESDDRANGFTVTPVIGTSTINQTSSTAVLRTIAQLRRQINTLNARQ